MKGYIFSFYLVNLKFPSLKRDFVLFDFFKKYFISLMPSLTETKFLIFNFLFNFEKLTL